MKAEEKRKIIDEEMAKLQKTEFTKNVVYPKYSFDERLKVDREIDQPPIQRFLPLGYDRNPGDMTKHYRKFYEDELENIPEIMPRKPFDEVPVVRGNLRGQSK